MTFSKEENFRIPEFCEDCPLTQGMDQLEIRQTTNSGPDIDVWYVNALPADPVIYAHDPDYPEAGAIEIGRDNLAGDAFCECHESASSFYLGQAHEAVAECDGPQEQKGIFGRKKPPICGAGFKEIGGMVTKLNGTTDSKYPLVFVKKTPIKEQ